MYVNYFLQVSIVRSRLNECKFILLFEKMQKSEIFVVNDHELMSIKYIMLNIKMNENVLRFKIMII